MIDFELIAVFAVGGLIVVLLFVFFILVVVKSDVEEYETGALKSMPPKNVSDDQNDSIPKPDRKH